MIITLIRSKDGNDNVMYTFVAPRCNTNRHLRIGELVLNPGETYTVEEIPLIELYSSSYEVVKAISNEKDTLTGKEYRTRLEELKSKADWDEDSDDYNFRLLEDEFEYKKFLRDYKPIKEVVYEKIGNVEISVENFIEITSQYLIPARHLGSPIDNPMVTYKRRKFYLDYIASVMQDLGFSPTESLTSQQPKLYYLKEYSDEISFWIERSQLMKEKIPDSFVDKLDNVKAKMDEDRKYIDKLIDFYYKGRRTSYNLYDLYKLLAEIKLRIINIVPMQKSISQKGYVLGFINDKMKEIKSITNEGE